MHMQNADASGEILNKAMRYLRTYLRRGAKATSRASALPGCRSALSALSSYGTTARHNGTWRAGTKTLMRRVGAIVTLTRYNLPFCWRGGLDDSSVSGGRRAIMLDPLDALLWHR